MPTFSVIIPAYNSERFIERTIKSVLNQTFTDFELIIVDDGSNDNTDRLIKKAQLKDTRIKVISTPNSGGPTIPTNIGINVAKGEYVAFLDHDDEWREDKLQKIYDVVKKNPDIGFFASNVDQHHDKTKKKTTGVLKLEKDNLPVEKVLAGSYFNTFSMLVIKKSVLDRVGTLDTGLLVFADYDLVARMVANNVLYKFLNDSLVTYHIHDNNTSSLERTAHRRAQDLESIITKYQKTFLKYPKSLSAVYHAIARLHLHLGNKKEAVVSFKKAIKHHPFGIANYARLLAALGGERLYKVLYQIRSKTLRSLE